MNDVGLGIFQFFEHLAGAHELSGLQAILDRLAQTGSGVLFVIGIILCIIGLLQCFLGYKFFRFWCGLIGFIVGCFFGLIIASTGIYTAFPVGGGLIGLIITIILGATGSVIAYGTYLVGLFLYAFTAAFIVTYYLSALVINSIIICLIAGVVAGIVIGVIAVEFRRFWIITTTAIAGGIAATAGLMMITQSSNLQYGFIMPIILIIAGFVVQYFTVRKAPRKTVRPLAVPTGPPPGPSQTPHDAPPQTPPQAPPQVYYQAPPQEPNQVPPVAPVQAPPQEPYQAPPMAPVQAPPQDAYQATLQNPYQAPPTPVAAPPQDIYQAPPQDAYQTPLQAQPYATPPMAPPVAPIPMDPPPVVPSPVAPPQESLQPEKAPANYRCIECGFAAKDNSAPCSSCGGAAMRAP